MSSLAPFPSWDPNNLLLCALTTIAMQLFFYLIAAACKFDLVTDFAGGTNFLLLAILTLVLRNEYSAPRPLVATTLVTLWAIRIAAFLLFRILKLGKDDRFDGKRESPLRFLVFWIFQMVWVFTVSLPLIFINGTTPTSESSFTSPWEIAGTVLFILGLLVETVADLQKFSFKQRNPSAFCSTGLWAFSRHPNYFGEITLWWGMFLIGIPTYFPNHPAQFAAVLSPIFTMAILLFLSGMPILETQADKKYGTTQSYRDYKRVTSPLIPLPTALYAALPDWFKTVFLFEFPLYNKLNYQD